MVAHQVTLLFGMIPPHKKKKSEVIIKVLPPCPLRALRARPRAWLRPLRPKQRRRSQPHCEGRAGGREGEREGEREGRLRLVRGSPKPRCFMPQPPQPQQLCLLPLPRACGTLSGRSLRACLFG
jgi:hypothetical protein